MKSKLCIAPEDQAKFYKGFMGLNLGISIAQAKVVTDSESPVLVVPKGLNYDLLEKVMQQHKLKYFVGLDGAVSSFIDPSKEERYPKTASYLIEHRGRQESDEENKNLTAAMISARVMPTMTLLEVWAYALMFKWKFKINLNGIGPFSPMELPYSSTSTLACGSRTKQGYTPLFMELFDRLTQIDYCEANRGHESFRARTVKAL